MAGEMLYHVTRRRDAETVFRQGLNRGEKTPAQKRGEELTEEAGDSPAARMEESSTEKAERWFDEVIEDAKRATDGAGEFPPHRFAVFFWPKESVARRAATDAPWGAVVVGVDTAALPSDCICAIGPTLELDGIFRAYWRAARDRGSVDDDEQFERAKEWWRSVEVYEGSAKRNHEVWCGCDVPPHAIEWIQDPDSGRRLYEPPDEDQRRLFEYEDDR